jgi:copper chaperone CopZ
MSLWCARFFKVASLVIWDAFAQKHQLTTVAAHGLLERSTQTKLFDELSEHGAVVVTGIQGLATANVAALRALAECGQSSFDGFHHKELLDGSQRWTLASQSRKDVLSPKLKQRCHDLEDELTPLRAIVGELGEHIVNGLAPAFDSLPTSQRHGGFVPLLSKGKQLEHFHIYDVAVEPRQTKALPFHTDAGAFLVLSRPLVFHEKVAIDEPESSGLVFHGSGTAQKLADDEVLLLAGEALRNFLGANVTVLGHAVRLSGLPVGSYRAWHGRMWLFPDHTANDRNETAGSLFMAPLKKAPTDSWLLGLKSDCKTSMDKCWMQIPCEDAKMCYDDSGSEVIQECLLPDKTSGTGKNACNQADAMNPKCQWRCPRGTSPNKSQPVGNSFCDKQASVSMYMNGFNSLWDKNRGCVILFFQGVILDKPWKFALGMVFVLSMGIATQGLVALRPVVAARTNHNRYVAALMFGLNVAMGWFMMLVAMTFSVELFICGSLGLILGHILFNGRGGSQEILGSPCCSAVNGANETRRVALTSQQLTVENTMGRPLLDGEKTSTLAIAGMTCDSCTATVAAALRGVEGVVAVAVDFAEQRAEVRFCEPANPLKLVDAVESVGFGAKTC